MIKNVPQFISSDPSSQSSFPSQTEKLSMHNLDLSHLKPFSGQSGQLIEMGTSLH